MTYSAGQGGVRDWRGRTNALRLGYVGAKFSTVARVGSMEASAAIAAEISPQSSDDEQHLHASSPCCAQHGDALVPRIPTLPAQTISARDGIDATTRRIPRVKVMERRVYIDRVLTREHHEHIPIIARAP